MIKCPYCDRAFNNESSLNSHKGKSHREEVMDEPARVRTTDSIDTLDITKRELEELRSKHNRRCDVCGKFETAAVSEGHKPNALCVDHEHGTNKFRGFLCVQCNRNFGWYDKYKKKIIKHENFENSIRTNNGTLRNRRRTMRKINE